MSGVFDPSRLAPDASGALRLDKTQDELAGFGPLFELAGDVDVLALAGLTTQTSGGETTLTGTTQDWGDATVELVHTDTALLRVTLRRAEAAERWLERFGLTLSGVTQVLEVARAAPDDTPLPEAWIEAVAGIGAVSLPLRATAHGDDALRVALDCTKARPELGDLLPLLGRDPHPDGDLRWLPEPLRDAGGIEVRSLAFTFAAKMKHPVRAAELRLGYHPETAWQVIPGLAFPKVTDLEVRLEVDRPLEPDLRYAEARLHGVIALDPAPQNAIDITADWPDLTLHGGLRKGGQIDLAVLLARLNTAGLPGAGPMAVTALDIAARPTGASASLALSTEIAGDWSVPLTPGRAFHFTDFRAAVSWGRKSGHAIRLHAAARIDTLPKLRMSAEGAAGGWVFSGRLAEADDTLTCDTWLTGFAGALGASLALPDDWPDFTLEDLRLTYDTAAHRIAATLRGRATATGAPNTALSLELTAQRDKTGAWRLTAGGTLARGDVALTLALVREGGASRIVAMFGDAQGGTDVVALLSELMDAPDPGVQIAPRAAVAAMQTGAHAAELAALDLDVHADLGALPLVGPMLHAAGGLSLAFQAVIASRALTAADAELVAMINDRLPEGATRLPDAEKIGKALTVAARITAGSETFDLDLPITADAKGTPVDDPAKPPPPAGDDGVKWLALDKTLGPVHLARLGARYGTPPGGSGKALTFLFDGGLSLGPVSLGLTGLSLSSPLDHLDLTPALDGLSLSYDTGPLALSGALLRDPTAPDSYAGTAALRVPALTLSALGAYARVGGETSVFVYATLDRPLGGPVFFFVTGLAAGFGYNRGLVLPPVKDLPDNPLIARAVNGGAGLAPEVELAQVRAQVPVALDRYFVAAGVKFNSFKLVDSFVLLAGQFGREFEIDLAGLSTAELPSPDAGGAARTPIARIEVALRASFRPEAGVLRVDAALTDRSFLIDPKCKLSGGFALLAHFSGPRAGEFVVSLGGYHPAFNLAAHPDYPRPERVAMNWPVSPETHIKGDLYCALTPGALMAGGHFAADYRSGHVHAWFHAGFDFLMEWKPFAYRAHAYVDIGGSYTFHFLGTHTISIDVGADVHVWGPEFGGIATISLYIASVHVHFGARVPSIPPPMTWDAFHASFLPGDDQMVTLSLVDGRKGAAAHPQPVAPGALAVVLDGAVPLTEVLLGGTAQAFPAGALTRPGVRPCRMAPGGLSAQHAVVIDYSADGKTGWVSAEKDFKVDLLTKQAPEALWGTYRAGESDAQHANRHFLPDPGVFGARIGAAEAEETKATVRVPRAALIAGGDGGGAVDWRAPGTADYEIGDDAARRARIDGIETDAQVIARRAGLAAAFGLEAGHGVSAQDFRAAPAIVREGS